LSAPRVPRHHWGTFHLTDEAIEQPMLDLAVARDAALRPSAGLAAGPSATIA
jgi:hypothetical protein